MRHPIWGPICWMILSRRMHVHTPVFYAKALSTPSWPICSLFIYPIFCLSSISLSFFLWLYISHHISVGCLDLSHWCLSHKHMQDRVCAILYCMQLPFQHLSRTVVSKVYYKCSMGKSEWKYAIICWTFPVQHLVTVMHRRGMERMGWNGARWKGRLESVCFPQTRDCWERGIKLLPSSDPWDFQSPSNF